MALIIFVDLDFEVYNDDYQTFVDFVQLQVKSLPSPSDFGKDNRWGEEQRKEGRIYCFRPPETRSLPLCILHHVFRQYLLDLEQPLPLASDTAIAAQIIAAKLCAEMGKSVSDKSTTAHIEPMYNLSPRRDAHGGIASGVILMNDILIALREMKAGPGASGDAYMQVARCYDLAVQVLLEDLRAKAFVRQGAPMFLLCVIGPVIDVTVSGGFYDGEKVIVEPLTDFRRMFEDALHVRQNWIARVLYALRKGIDKLEAYRLQPPTMVPPSPPSTPHIPPTRNEGIQGITWPGKPGYMIEQDHDEQLFESWWPNIGEEVRDESSLQSDVSLGSVIVIVFVSSESRGAG
ncbi:hypothetical protein APHAL10511_006867 [Amanita phalloides]|nr:hypothetical protein APHAL10511_006867 [Amanita phalloides]